MGVSMPVAWDQLSALKSGAQWTIATARENVSFQRDDACKDYWTLEQVLTAAMRQLNPGSDAPCRRGHDGLSCAA